MPTTPDAITSTYLASDALSLAKVSDGMMARSVAGVNIGNDLSYGGPLSVYGPEYAVDQSQTSTNGSWTGWGWQSFTAGVTGTLTAVEISCGTDSGITWTGTLSIYAGEGTAGTRLETQTVKGTFRAAHIFTLATPVSIVSGSVYTIYMHGGGAAGWRMSDCSGNRYTGGREDSYADYDYYFRTYVASTASAPALTVQPGTLNVGVGTDTAGFPLSFANVLGDKISLWGQSGDHYGFGIQSNLLQIYSGGAGADIALGYGQSSDFTETMRVKGNGNVGIGTSAPGAKLDVAGTIRCTSLTETSSMRYKQDIAPLRDDFQKLLLAEPKSYTRTDSPDRTEIGYIAEEIDALGLKPLVAYDKDGRPDGLSYDRMVLYLVEIAKSQKEMILDRDRRIADMEARLQRLEEKLEGEAPVRY